MAPTPTTPATFYRAKHQHHAGENASVTVSARQRTGPWGWMLVPPVAYGFDQYCSKFGSSHDRMTPFIAQQRRNGRMFPEGFFYQLPETPMTVEDYLASRLAATPMCLPAIATGRSKLPRPAFLPPASERSGNSGDGQAGGRSGVGQKPRFLAAHARGWLLDGLGQEPRRNLRLEAGQSTTSVRPVSAGDSAEGRAPMASPWRELVEEPALRYRRDERTGARKPSCSSL